MTTSLSTSSPAVESKADFVAKPNKPTMLECVWLALCIVLISGNVDFRMGPHSSSIPAVFSLAFVAAGLNRKVKSFPHLNRNVSAIGAFAVAVLSAVNAFTIIFHMHWMQTVSLFMLLAVLIWTAAGSKILRHFAPVLLFAAFAFTPTPDEVKQYLNIPLQHLSANAIVGLLSPFIPITGSGHLFNVNGQLFDVTPSCSGLNQWVALSYVFLMSSMFVKYKPIGFVVGLAADPVITLGMNVTRLTITALVAFFASKQEALAIHTNIEFAIFPIGLAILFLGLRRFKSSE